MFARIGWLGMLVLGGLLQCVWAEESPPLEWEHQFGHVAPITGAAFNEAGDRVVTISEDGLVYLWDAATGEKVRSFFQWEAGLIGFSRDGRWLVTGAKAGSVVVWNARTGQKVQTLKVPESLASLALSGDGSRLVTSSTGGTVLLWAARTGEKLQELPWQMLYRDKFVNRRVNEVRLSHDGETLAMRSENLLRVCNVKTGKTIAEFDDLAKNDGSLEGIPTTPEGFALSGDGKRLALSTGGRGASLVIWNIATGKRLLTEEANSSRRLALSDDGTLLARQTRHAVTLVDVATGKARHTIDIQEAYTLALSPDGKRLLATGYDGSGGIWDAESGKKIAPLGVKPDSPGCISLSGDGKRLVNVPSGRKVAQLWDMSKGGDAILCTQEQFIDTAHLSMDGRRLATSGFRGNVIRIWDASNGKELKTLGDDKMSIDCLSLSRDGGKLLAVMSFFDGGAFFWDTTTGKREFHHQHENAQYSRSSQALTADATELLSLVSRKQLVFWEPATGKKRRSLEVPAGTIASTLSISPDGKRLALATSDKEVIILDATTGKEIVAFDVHDIPLGLVFSEQGNRLVICNGLASGLVDVQAKKSRSLFLRPVRQAATFSDDGKRLVTATGDGSVEFHDTSDGRKTLGELFTVDGGADWIVIDAQGRYDGSEDAEKWIRYRKPGTNALLPVSETTRRSRTPGLLPKLWTGKGAG